MFADMVHPTDADTFHTGSLYMINECMMLFGSKAQPKPRRCFIAMFTQPRRA